MSRIKINPKTDALLVIDVQPTFMPGGGLPVKDGHKVVPVIKRLMKKFPVERRFASKDRHPRGHVSLASSYVGLNPGEVLEYANLNTQFVHTKGIRLAKHAKFKLDALRSYLELCRDNKQMLWPDHAIAGTEEAELHSAFKESDFQYVLTKGMNPCVDSYSAFTDNRNDDTGLADIIGNRVKRLFVVGLAYDFCVGFSAIDSTYFDYEAIVVKDATRAVDVPSNSEGYPGSVADIERLFENRGIKTISSLQIA